MKKTARVLKRYIFIRLLPVLILLPVATRAQLPVAGIYRLFNTSDNIFPPEHYVPYLVNPGQFYEVNLVPARDVTQYGLAYALVSADTLSGIIKIALLRDTVSKSGREKQQQLATNVSYNESWRPVFAQEFKISGDSVSGDLPFDGAFPDRPDIEGQWLFDRSLNGYSDVLAFVTLPPDREQLQRFDSASRTYRYGSRFTFEESFFNPYTRKAPYRDLAFTFDRGHIPLYERTTPHAAAVSYFQPGEYIAVLKDSAEWLAAERVTVIPDTERYYLPDRGVVEGATKLRIFSGWVKKEDLVPGPWIRQKQQTAQFRFAVSGDAGDAETFTEGRVDGLLIIGKKTGRRQVLLHIGAALNSPLSDVVQVQDCNFDGYPDIWIEFQNGGAGPNYTRNFYLYNPVTQQFDYNPSLSDLSQVEVDSRSKIITSAWRDGAAHHGGEQYTFAHDTLTKISYWDDYCNSEYFCTHSSGKYVKNKWQETKYYSGTITVKATGVFPAPDNRQQATGTLSKGDEADIRKETPLWFYVEGSDSSGHAVNGWIPKTALLPHDWIPFTARTAQYRFAAATPDSFSITAFRVTDQATGHIVQIIPVYESVTLADSLFQTGDYNADGQADFRIETYRDAEEVDYDYYLYDKKEAIFKLQQLPAAVSP